MWSVRHRHPNSISDVAASKSADYTLRIKVSPIEIGHKRIISTITYNGQFPGPLLRFKEGRPVTVEIFNDTDTPEQLHWHGQKVPVDVDGAVRGRYAVYSCAWQAADYVYAGARRFSVLSHAQSGGANLAAGQYSGEVGPVYIEPRMNRAAMIAKSFWC